MAKLSNFYIDNDIAIDALETTYAAIKKQLPVDPETSATDWYQSLWKVQDAINKLQVRGSIHQFERVTRDQMLNIFSSFDQGLSRGKIVIAAQHTFRSIDTPRSLELQYGVPYERILDYNNIGSDELMATTPGSIVLIPIPLETTRRRTDILVYGSQIGDLILGKDLPNDIIEGDDGDLKFLEPREAFRQAIDNLSQSSYGDLPFYEGFGLNLRAGEDMLADVQESIVQLNIYNGLNQDPRIEAINIVRVERSQNSIEAVVEIQPIHGEALTVPIPRTTIGA